MYVSEQLAVNEGARVPIANHAWLRDAPAHQVPCRGRRVGWTHDALRLFGRTDMTLGTILLIVLLLLVIGALPTWPYSRQWGLGPSGGLGVVLIVVVVLFFMGRF